MNLASHNTTDNSIQKLEKAFAAFNQVSENLENRYQQLELKVSHLNAELAVSHSKRLKELKAKEQIAAKLSSLMEALPGGVIVLDSQNIITEENPAAINILGNSYIKQYWQHTIETVSAEQAILEGEISLANGKRISISSQAYGNLGNTIILLTDVTENYRLNTIVNREERLAALGEMAGRLAHQLRTPLSSAILYVSHLDSAEKAKTTTNSAANKILSRLKQIENLVDGMLSYIRGDEVPTTTFSVRELLQEVKEITTIQIKSANGSINLVLPSDECKLTGDKDALLNAITNLVDNSLNSVQVEPLITLTLKIIENSYVISVKDNGAGIDKNIRKKIFDPFFSTKSKGTGLGLAVVMSAINAFSGKINVKSAIPMGAEIELVIPTSRFNLPVSSGLWNTKADSSANQNVFEVRSAQ